uniref:Reverse transcriptase domain-containing protein n=1 Tax=Nicotiana tabacum TaxID=4097 RepID=A0A1S3X689_TOBAC|nr:PREDICTED: uncharacterized protein LOC107761633 [Nicotiana tabacum]
MGGDSEHFPVVMGLHQGSAFSPFLFALTMDVLAQNIQRKCHEYLECKFNDGAHESHVDVKLDTQVKKGSFKYLRSIIQGNKEINEDVAYCIGTGWMKWRLAVDVLCDRNVPSRLKGKFMRMLRWMSGYPRRDKIRNEAIRDKVRVASVEDKIRESSLKWFGHAKRRSIDAFVRRYERLTMVGLRKGRGRPRKLILAGIESGTTKYSRIERW